MTATSNKAAAAQAETTLDSQAEQIRQEEQATTTVRAAATAAAIANSKAFRITQTVVNTASTIGGLIAMGAAVVYAKNKIQDRGNRDDRNNDGNDGGNGGNGGNGNNR